MTAKDIRKRILKDCNGDKKMAMDIYNQFKRSYQEDNKTPLKNVCHLEVERNDYLDEEYKYELGKVIWVKYTYITENFSIHSTRFETCLSDF